MFGCKKDSETKERNSYFPCLVPKENGKETDVLLFIPFFMFREIKYYSRKYFLINLERREFLLKQNNGEFKAIWVILYYKKLSNYFNIQVWVSLVWQKNLKNQ